MGCVNIKPDLSHAFNEIMMVVYSSGCSPFHREQDLQANEQKSNQWKIERIILAGYIHRFLIVAIGLPFNPASTR